MYLHGVQGSTTKAAGHILQERASSARNQPDLPFVRHPEKRPRILIDLGDD